jgi:hypothetical protein
MKVRSRTADARRTWVSLAVVRRYVFQVQIYRSRLTVTAGSELTAKSGNLLKISFEKRGYLVAVDRHQRSHLFLDIFEKCDFPRAILLRHKMFSIYRYSRDRSTSSCAGATSGKREYCKSRAC